MGSGLEWYQAMKDEARKDRLSDEVAALNVVIDAALHRRIRIAAASVNKSMKDLICELLDQTLPMFEEEG
jgi:predicted HicB family RNase H-like nuclease